MVTLTVDSSLICHYDLRNVDTYQNLLKTHIAEKSQNNRRFSLRSISMKAGISHTLLSLVLKEKRNLSKDTALRLASALKLNRKERTYFIRLVEYQGRGSEKYKNSILKEIENDRSYDSVKELSIQSFRLIADWYHSAIIELTEISKLTASCAAFVAKELGISLVESQNAIQRLLDLEVLEVTGSGYLKKSNDVVSVLTVEVPSKFIREHHRQMIEKSIHAMDNQPTNERYMTDLTLSLNQTQLPEAYDLIEEFKTKMARLMTETKNRDAVYQLNFQLFSLYKLRKGQKKS